jgi:uncharacterized repeat protein (TIGR01451 family)
MNRFLKPSVLATLLALVLAAPAFAQPSTNTDFTLNGLTRQGVTITNVATASYTDANNNPYAQVQAEASVTVGYLASLDIISQPTQAPAGPSADNELPIELQNNGNGPDQFTLSVSIPAGIENVRYVVDGATYADLDALNAYLATRTVEADYSLNITVLYDVPDGYGGVPLSIVVTATSNQAPDQTGGTDSTTTIITPILEGDVDVTPDLEAVQQLPSNGTQYTATYTVSNTQNIGATFDLSTVLEGGSVLSVVSVNGGTTSVFIGANQSQTITVVYMVADDATAGTVNTLVLVATSQADGAITDSGSYVVTVIRPSLTMTKTAYRDGRAALIGIGTVLPGEYIEYRIEISNGGNAVATMVEIVDALPSQVTFAGLDFDTAADWTSSEVDGTVTASLNGSLAPGGSRYIWIRAQVR